MSIEFICDYCRQLLKTPEGSEGKKAICPHCGNQMFVPGPQGVSDRQRYQRQPEILPPEPDEEYRTGRRSEPSLKEFQTDDSLVAEEIERIYLRKKVLGPGNGLIALGIINMFGVVLLLEVDGRQNFESPSLIFIACASLLLLVGGVQMKRLKSYSLAMWASVLAMLPCTFPCCFVGFFIGLWSLITLLDPRVKRGFQEQLK